MTSQTEQLPDSVAEQASAARSSDPRAPRATALHRVIWGVLGLAVLLATVQIATFDIRERPLVGDEASHVLQALSLAYDGNLSYDMGDLDRFAELEWPGATRPNGVFFQRYRHGWAFAKPYGWSATAAPFVRIFGPVPGLALASAALFLTVVAAAFAIGRRAGRYGSAFAVTSVVASVTWFYGFSAHSELFLVALISLTTLCLVEYWHTDRIAWLLGAAVLAGVAVSEKPTFALGLAPVLLLLTWRRGFRNVLIGGLATAAGFMIAIVPYLFYSDFDSWNPYAGARYYRGDGALPFAPEAPPFSSYRLMTESAENFSPSVIYARATRAPGEGAHSFLYEIVGRHTGMLVFLPLTLAMLVFALTQARRQARRADAIVVVAGILLYIGLYALLYPSNYFGGNQSLGNRYLVQMSPLALAAFVFARPKPRTLVIGWVSGTLLAVAFLYPHLASPDDAFVRLDRTSPLQDQMPEEDWVTGIRLFRCGIPAVMWGAFEPYEDRVERIRTQEECLGVPSSLPPDAP